MSQMSWVKAERALENRAHVRMLLRLRQPAFDRRVLAPAYRAAGWRDADGDGTWTWHSLRHVFCTTALFCWRLEATDVSCIAGHANVRVTLDMYVGATAGVLDRARPAPR